MDFIQAGCGGRSGYGRTPPPGRAPVYTTVGRGISRAGIVSWSCPVSLMASQTPCRQRAEYFPSI